MQLTRTQAEADKLKNELSLSKNSRQKAEGAIREQLKALQSSESNWETEKHKLLDEMELLKLDTQRAERQAQEHLKLYHQVTMEQGASASLLNDVKALKSNLEDLATSNKRLSQDVQMTGLLKQKLYDAEVELDQQKQLVKAAQSDAFRLRTEGSQQPSQHQTTNDDSKLRAIDEFYREALGRATGEHSTLMEQLNQASHKISELEVSRVELLAQLERERHRITAIENKDHRPALLSEEDSISTLERYPSTHTGDNVPSPTRTSTSTTTHDKGSKSALFSLITRRSTNEDTSSQGKKSDKISATSQHRVYGR